MLLCIHVALLLALAFRIMLFSRHGRRRPLVAWLAYLVMVAAFAQAIQASTGMVPPPTLAGLVLEGTLALAVYCQGGNLAELFKSSGSSRLCAWLCWSPNKKVKS